MSLQDLLKTIAERPRKTQTLRAWTGPTAVKETAKGLRALGVTVTVEGTEHVHVTVVRDTPAEAEAALSWVLRGTRFAYLKFSPVR